MAITKYRRPVYPSWTEFDDMTNRLSRLFEEPFFGTVPHAGRWMPAVSVSETKDELLLTAELPGMKEEDISVELENNVLTVSGEKTEVREEDDEERKYHLFERSFGSFTRSFTLPRTVDGAQIIATFDNGVLTVKLPKVPEAKGRKIEISK
jgi:HSP20 family protein